MDAPKAKKKTKPPRRGARRGYHHGNLREALIDTVVRLVERDGPEKVTVREAARHAGVSSGAPFRHFPNKVALMTAVAEEAMGRLRAYVEGALEETAGENPLARFRAIGTAYLRWAFGNPTQFQIISTRSWLDFEGSASLRRDNDALRTAIQEILGEARRRGRLRRKDTEIVALAGRALVYGLARMEIDGHFPSWDVPARETSRVAEEVLDLFVSGLDRG